MIEQDDEDDSAGSAYARRDVLQWEDLAQCATVLPELESAVHELIETRLGWLPHPKYRLKHEPFLRGLLLRYRSGQLDWDAFTAQADEHLKQIRNEEMRRNTDPDYSPELYDLYNTHMAQQRETARNRVCWLVGYEPPLSHSLTAELWLREALAKDRFHLGSEVTPIDMKVLTLLRYRAILLTEGIAAANASPLILVAMEAATEA